MEDFASKDNYEIGFEDNLDYAHVIDEISADDISLASFKPHDTLNPELWDGMELDHSARLRLLDIGDDFWESCDIPWVQVSDMLLVGSSCNYNWSSDSDIDLHLLVDFSKVDNKTDFVKQYLDDKKNLWNNKHTELTLYGIPVEVYVQDINEKVNSGGIYSLYKNEWLKEPDKGETKVVSIDKRHVKSMCVSVMDKIDELEEDYATHTNDAEARRLIKVCDRIKKKVKKIRKESLAKNGEWSDGNIMYKVLRRSGYLKKLDKIAIGLYDSINSLEK